MLIGGLQKLSLLDYPDHLSAIIFTQGCNFRCRFCYNPMLVLPARPARPAGREGEIIKKGHSFASPPTKNFGGRVKESDLFDFLKLRVGKLEAVVITGGEPTLYADLPQFISKIKKFGYKVKLDTNGSNPEMLLNVIDKINYIAMDIKAPLEKYEKIIGVKTDLNNIKKSIKIIIESGTPYEFRTTIAPGLLDKKDITKMGELIRGADSSAVASAKGGKWYLQFFKSDTDLVDAGLKGKKAFSRKEMEEMAEIGRKYVKRCEIR